MAQLSWPAAERVAFVLLVTGMSALAVAAGAGDATAIRGAALLVAAGAVSFGASLVRVVHHVMPRVMPRAPLAGRAVMS